MIADEDCDQTSQPGFTIVGRASSINVRKVLWTCDEIGLSYRFDADWLGEARDRRRPELLAVNPNDQFPVLIDQHGPLWESNTICRYLAAESGRTDLLPFATRAVPPSNNGWTGRRRSLTAHGATRSPRLSENCPDLTIRRISRRA